MDYEVLFVDIDGVVWMDGRPIRQNINALKKIQESGTRIIYLTNNSTRSRSMYADRLSELGLRAGTNSIVNSGYSASIWLKRHHGPARVLMVGEEGLAEELIQQGHKLVTPSDYEKAEAVVVGLDRGLTYYKLDAAARAIRRGALFIATNRDNMYPTPTGLAPGAGSIVAFLETASGKSITFDAGKPNPWILEAAYMLLGYKPGKAAVVGDRVDTDMMLAKNASVDGILVLTGVARERRDSIPGWVKVVNTLMDLL